MFKSLILCYSPSDLNLREKQGERGRDGLNKEASECEWRKKRLFSGYIENNCFERMRPIKALTDTALQ